MARARNIKPAIFLNELLGTADIHLTVVFISLWCLADCEGKLEDRPMRIKAETFPYRDDVTQPVFNGYLTELERLGFIQRYSVDDIKVIKVINFTKHQSPHHTEKPKKLPEPPSQTVENQVDTNLTVNYPLSNGRNQVTTRSDSLIPDLLIPDLLIEDVLIPEDTPAQEETSFPETDTLLDNGFKTEVNETLTWLLNKKGVHKRNLPTKEWLDWFTDLEAEKIDLKSFRSFYEFCEQRDWIIQKKAGITPNVMRRELENFKKQRSTNGSGSGKPQIDVKDCTECQGVGFTYYFDQADQKEKAKICKHSILRQTFCTV